MLQQQKTNILSPGAKSSYTERFLNPELVIKQLGIESGMRIAHFGCGNGYFTFPLARKIGSDGILYAIDVQEEKVISVKNQARNMGLGNIKAIRANLEKKDGSGIESDSTDCVFIINMLYQSDKRSKVIGEAKRVLRTGGKIIIIDWKESSGSIGPEAASKVTRGELIKISKKHELGILKEIEASNFHFGMILKK